MKRFYLILIGLLAIILLVSCNGTNSDLASGSTNSIKSENLENSSLKKSVVFRVKLFSRYKSTRNHVAVLLENGDKLCFRQIKAETPDWLFLEKGDTLVYKNNNIMNIYWK
ncbi:MAG: hypothetical protein IKW39_05245 [Alphaproteobacteria bacterium]|nr:hypothetical protein [Alphaproteobacteria bacterium]